jgi:endonuclease/exonuclease/phosphatase family metal-dependent hydrolase
VRILTFNVLADRADWNRRSRVVRSGLRTLDADLVALQETVIRPGRDQVAELLGAGYHVVHGDMREADGTGMSLASRWPIRRSWQRALPTSSRVRAEEFSHQLMAVLVDAPALGRVLLASPKPTFRLGHEVEREVMSVAAAGVIEQIAEECGAEHVVCAGDFDAVPESSSMRFWRGLQSLQDTSVAYVDVLELVHGSAAAGMSTFDPHRNSLVDPSWRTGPPRRIDYVLVRCGPKGPSLHAKEARVVLDKPVNGVWPSDHFGVFAMLGEPPG